MVSHDIEFCASYGDTCAMFFDGSVITSQSAKAFLSEIVLYNSGKPDGETVISGCSNSKGSDRSMQQKQATGVDTKAMLPIFLVDLWLLLNCFCRGFPCRS